LVLVAGGCGGVISKEIRGEAAPVKGLEDVRRDPGRYQGRTVILGGDIIAVENQKSSTVLTVLDRPLNFRDRPQDSDASEGRFLVKVSRYLEPFVFAPGRTVTVAGTVAGTETFPLGKTTYVYVVLEAKQVYLWPKERHYFPPYYDADSPWYPYGYDPFWGPRWWGPPNYHEFGESERERHEERGVHQDQESQEGRERR
jgi:outer membrane lipoprotein